MKECLLDANMLLGLAVHRDGVLATLDRGLEAVAGVDYQHALEIVSP